MSHIATIKTAIKDLDAVKAVCAELGLEFNEGKNICTYYASRTVPCTHTMSKPAFGRTEIGLVLQPDGSYSMVCDEMLMSRNNKETYNQKTWGQATNPLANQFGGFMQRYAVCKTEIEARKKGWMTRRTTLGTKVQVHVTGM